MTPIEDQRPRGAALSCGADLQPGQVFVVAHQRVVQIGSMQPFFRRLGTGEYLRGDASKGLGRDRQEPFACRYHGFRSIAAIAQLWPGQV